MKKFLKLEKRGYRIVEVEIKTGAFSRIHLAKNISTSEK
jgi:hypothetical protein